MTKIIEARRQQLCQDLPISESSNGQSADFFCANLVDILVKEGRLKYYKPDDDMCLSETRIVFAEETARGAIFHVPDFGQRDTTQIVIEYALFKNQHQPIQDLERNLAIGYINQAMNELKMRNNDLKVIKVSIGRPQYYNIPQLLPA